MFYGWRVNITIWNLGTHLIDLLKEEYDNITQYYYFKYEDAFVFLSRDVRLIFVCMCVIC